MGAETWSCFAPYREKIADALEESQQREFAAGRYRNADGTHSSINEATLAGDSDGTCSILDMFGVADFPEILTIPSAVKNSRCSNSKAIRCSDWSPRSLPHNSSNSSEPSGQLVP
jgi:hypothetical protein